MDRLLSIVVPVFNEAEGLPDFCEALRVAADELPIPVEFIFVDDGSQDGTAKVLHKLRLDDDRVKFLRLSRNFGHQAALSAGLRRARGDLVVMMDGDGQHPPGLIPRLIEQFEAGFEVVNTQRRATADAGWLKRTLSRCFYQLFNRLANTAVIPGGADFRLMSRRAIDELNKLPEVHRFLRGLVPWLGFSQTVVPFDAPPRKVGQSRFTTTKNLQLALDGLTAFGHYPLRRVALLGWAVASVGFLYGLFALAAHMVTGHTVPGWTSLLCCVLFLGGSQLLVAGVLGEYLGRILEQVKGRPAYVIREEVGLKTRKPKRRVAA